MSPAPPKTFVIESSRLARCSPEAVIETVLDPSTWPRWQSEIVSTDGAQPLAEGDVVRGRAKLLGFSVEGMSSAASVAPDAFEEDVIVGVRMRVRYHVHPARDGAVISQRMVADLPRGVVGRGLSFLLRWRLAKMQRNALAELARRCEAAPST